MNIKGMEQLVSTEGVPSWDLGKDLWEIKVRVKFAIS